MVVIMLAGVMFPLWPIKLRIGAWYLSMGLFGLVGAFIVLAIVRLILWCITVLSMKRAIWIFPNLFEDVGFVSRLDLERAALIGLGRLIHPGLGVRRTEEEETEAGQEE